MIKVNNNKNKVNLEIFLKDKLYYSLYLKLGSKNLFQNTLRLDNFCKILDNSWQYFVISFYIQLLFRLNLF